MKFKKILTVLSCSLALAAALPVMAAQDSQGSLLGANSAFLKSDADAKIDARVKALNSLADRISQMKNITDTQKGNLIGTLKASAEIMSKLKAKIDADTDKDALKNDIQSITKDYRVYLLILPQGRIAAAGDRIVSVAAILHGLGDKFQARIEKLKQSGKDVTALNTNLADMLSKATDADSLARSSITEVASLQIDNGNQSIFQSNQLILKDVRNKIQTATNDLKTARQDANLITKALNTK